MRNRASLLMFALLMGRVPAAAAELPNEPVHALEMTRYSGQWHEIARLPMYFQRKCLDGVVATYSPRPDGTIDVHNTCRTAKGQKSVDGVARMKDGLAGALEVRFAPRWLTWLPMSWAEYWVIEVDPDYQWAVVGSPNLKHLWILSRQPAMNRALFDRLREHARQRGYQVDHLIITAPVE